MVWSPHLQQQLCEQPHKLSLALQSSDACEERPLLPCSFISYRPSPSVLSLLFFSLVVNDLSCVVALNRTFPFPFSFSLYLKTHS